MIERADGVLAIWNDIRAGREALFEDWYKNEHFPERLAVPGFRLGRRYEAATGVGGGAPRYFCFYLVDNPGVLVSPSYMARLNDPTPLTRRIMTEAFANMNRTACRRAARFGASWGAYAVTARFARAPEPGRMAPLLERWAGEPGVARAEHWIAETDAGGPATEERLRGGDRKIAACTFVDTLRETDAARAADTLRAEFGTAAEIGVYRLLSAIARSDGA